MKMSFRRTAARVAFTFAAVACLSAAAARAADVPAAAPSPLTLAVAHLMPPDVAMTGVHYRPRGNNGGGWIAAPTATQFHLGFFNPNGQLGTEFLAGLRVGPMVDPHVQIGASLDWSHRTDRTSSGGGAVPVQSPFPVTAENGSISKTVDLVPMMVFVQVSGDENMKVIPYMGLAGGWEYLNLTADPVGSDPAFDVSCGGWGWQVWGGAALPLSGRVRASGELVFNAAEPSGDFPTASGGSQHGHVTMNGVGLRAGISWGY